MVAFRYFAPALALASGAVAQSLQAACGSGGTTTIQSNADATGLANCQTYSGSIAIATGTTDNIQLSGVKSITGSLVANNATKMASLEASSLQSIGDSFTLESLIVLSTLSFPALTEVDTIDWTALPALQSLTFTEGVQKVHTLHIDNTQLNTLDGINLAMVSSMSVTNNPFLKKISMQLGNVTDALNIGANAKMLSVEFPNLIWANNMTIRNASTVSVPSLASVNGSLGLYSDSFQSFASPNLTSVGGSLSFVSCNSVTNISLPQLTLVGGGFQVANNTALKTIDGFPALKTVGGALDFNGAFQNVSLPQLSDVRGAFNLQSTQDIDDACSHFSGLSGMNNVIKGTYTCKGQENHPGGTGTLPAGTNSGSSSGNSSSKSTAPLTYPAATSMIGVIVAIFGLL